MVFLCWKHQHMVRTHVSNTRIPVLPVQGTDHWSNNLFFLQAKSQASTFPILIIKSKTHVAGLEILGEI